MKKEIVTQEMSGKKLKNLYKIEKYNGEKLGFTSYNADFKCFNLDQTTYIPHCIPITIEAESEAEFLIKLRFAGFDFNKVTYKKVSSKSITELVKIKCAYDGKLLTCFSDLKFVVPFVTEIIIRKYGKNYKGKNLTEPMFIQSFRNDIMDFILSDE